jgi:xylitol oxidase
MWFTSRFMTRSRQDLGMNACHIFDQIRDHISPMLYISEIRTIARDRLWMSPSYEQDCVAIHFTWKQDVPRVQQVLPLIEKQLEPFQARPHWGKLFSIPPERFRELYVKLPDFQQLLMECDPHGKFRNRFLSTYIYGD